MKQLAILLPDGGITLSCLALTVEVFEKANAYFIEKGKAPVFNVTLVGNAKGKSVHQGAFTIKQDKSIHDKAKYDLIIVPSLGDDVAGAIKQNKETVAWITDCYKSGTEVASLCTGAFILAAGGLLTDKQCSTHWGAAELFKNLYPDVQLAIEKIITDEHGIYTTGGALSSMSLVLHIIEKYYNRETAIFCAKVFEIDLDRIDQSAFIIFSGQKNHADKEIRKAQLFMENNVSGKIMIDDISSKFSIDRRNFDRRFKKATGNTPLEYIQRVKIEAAKKSLETGRKPINEVMYDVGYTDVKAFREIFRRITGLSPIAYRSKFNREAMVV